MIMARMKDLGKIVSDDGVLDIAALKRLAGFTKIGQSVPIKHLQLLQMFDITGSMFGYFDLVREKFNEIVSEVKTKVPDLESAIMAYRNHGDEKTFDEIYYSCGFASEISPVADFLRQIRKGGGGADALTCLEDCLHEANTLTWSQVSAKAIILVGDMPPHGVVDSIGKCPREIDYRHEVEKLASKGVVVYSVFCGDKENSKVYDFYRWIAKKTKGLCLDINEIGLLKEIIIGASMRQTNQLEEHMGRLKAIGRLTPKVESVLALMK
jgi:hypothetical protein